MIKTGYKVLICDMTSTAMYLVNGGKKYFRNKRNIPKKKCGPLVLFKTLKAAKKYSNEIRRIFKCRYKVSSEKKAYDLCGYSADKYEIARSSSGHGAYFTAKDIALADWVELLEEIMEEFNVS